jgi:hypothetical protein
MTAYAKERQARLHWHEPTQEDHLTAHLFDDRFPAWSICHRIQRARGFVKAAKRPATSCAACAHQYGELLEWIAKSVQS